MSLVLPVIPAQRRLDRQHVNEQIAAASQEQAEKLGLRLEYIPCCRRVDVYRYAAPLCTLFTAGELRMFLTGYEVARHQMEKELLALVARLEAQGIDPMGRVGEKR